MRKTASPRPRHTRRLSGSGPKLFGPDGQLLVASCLEGPKVERRTHAATAAATGAAPVDAVYRCRPGDTKQRLWYMFDHTLVLPEYLVEFQYQLSPSSAKLQVRSKRRRRRGRLSCLAGAAPAPVILWWPGMVRRGRRRQHVAVTRALGGGVDVRPQPRTPHALGPASSALSHDMVSTIINGLEPELRCGASLSRSRSSASKVATPLLSPFHRCCQAECVCVGGVLVAAWPRCAGRWRAR